MTKVIINMFILLLWFGSSFTVYHTKDVFVKNEKTYEKVILSVFLGPIAIANSILIQGEHIAKKKHDLSN